MGTAYCQVGDFLTRRDVGVVGPLLADDKTAPSQAQIENPATTYNAVLQALLTDASGYVESACLHAGTYQPTDLAGLTGNSQGLLIRLVCDIAFETLRRRRGITEPEVSPEYKEATELLDRIRTGERVFNVAGVIEAGNVDVDAFNPYTQSLQNAARDWAHRYFPPRTYPFF